MTVDRILAVIGIAIGLPAFILTFLSGGQAATLLVAALVLAVLGAAFIIHIKTNAAPFYMKEVVLTLSIHDPEGKLATLEKKYKYQANYAHVQELSHRNIAADGSIYDIRWNGEPVPPANIATTLGEYEVSIREKTPYTKGSVYDGCLSYRMADSFPAAQEAMIYVVDFPCKVLRIIVKLPTDRKCHQVNAYRMQGAGKKEITKNLCREEDGRRISFTVKRPPLGSQYEVWWRW